MADITLPVGITPEGVVIDVTVDERAAAAIRRAARHEALTEAEQAIRREREVGGYNFAASSGLGIAARLVADLRQGCAS